MLKQLLNTVDGDWELLEEVVELYFSDAPKQMSRIQIALQANDSLEVREAAHSLKGATGAFGKNQVYELALRLEQIGKSGDLQHAHEFFLELDGAIATMERVSRQEIAERREEKR